MSAVCRTVATIVAIPFAVAGCMSVPLTSIWELRHVELRTTDLQALRVAVRLPESIRPRPGGVDMMVVIQREGEPDTRTMARLTEVQDAGEIKDLPPAPKAGTAAYVYRLTSADIDHFTALRTQMEQWHATGQHGSLGMGIETKEFCRVGPLPNGPLPVTTYLKTSELGHYIVLTGDLDLRSDRDLVLTLKDIGPC